MLLVWIYWVTLCVSYKPSSPSCTSWHLGEIQVMGLGQAPFDPPGMNLRGIGCKHIGRRHPAWGDCCTVPLSCDIHAWCCKDIYWIKEDHVVLYFFQQFKRLNRKAGRALRRQKLLPGVSILKKAHACPRSLPKMYISCSFEVKKKKSYNPYLVVDT